MKFDRETVLAIARCYKRAALAEMIREFEENEISKKKMPAADQSTRASSKDDHGADSSAPL